MKLESLEKILQQVDSIREKIIDCIAIEKVIQCNKDYSEQKEKEENKNV